MNILHGLIFTEKDFEYAQSKEFWYLNLKIGILVMEYFDDVFVAKTFLKMDMLDKNLQWYMPLLNPEIKKDINVYSWSIKKIMNTDPIQIKPVLHDAQKIEAVLERFKKETALIHITGRIV